MKIPKLCEKDEILNILIGMTMMFGIMVMINTIVSIAS